jgi:hypothetical protein
MNAWVVGLLNHCSVIDLIQIHLTASITMQNCTMGCYNFLILFVIFEGKRFA